MTEPSVRIDADAGAAYLRLSRATVSRTVVVSQDVLVDLDESGGVVGVELLDLETPLPGGLAERFLDLAGLDLDGLVREAQTCSHVRMTKHRGS